jgi:hypothetical protein
MGNLPTQKKILREDIKDAPPWAMKIVDTLNSFMESVYTALNKNITFTENTASFVKEVVYTTPSTYPTMDNVSFMNTLKTRASGVLPLQIYDRSTYTAPSGPCFIPWVETKGTIVLGPITGLAPDKTYVVRVLVI